MINGLLWCDQHFQNTNLPQNKVCAISLILPINFKVQKVHPSLGAKYVELIVTSEKASVVSSEKICHFGITASHSSDDSHVENSQGGLRLGGESRISTMREVSYSKHNSKSCAPDSFPLLSLGIKLTQLLVHPYHLASSNHTISLSVCLDVS